MIVATVVKSSAHPSLGIRGSQIDWTGVHCAKTLIASKILRIIMEMFQNHRKALCLEEVSQLLLSRLKWLGCHEIQT